MKINPLALARFLPLFALANPVIALAVDACDGSMEKPCIVQDTSKTTKDVKHWRYAKMIIDSYNGNTSGLKHMWVSASGAPTAKGFKIIAENIDKLTNGKYKKMIDLDLRQEDHAYLNKQSITLTTQYNWINLGKSYQQALAAEQDWIQALHTQTTINNVLTSDQFKAGNYLQGSSVSIEDLRSEQQVAESHGFEYIRLTVSDHMAPRIDDVDKFVSLVRSLPKDVWVHMHCRGGDGRSSTFLAMYDMLKNADTVSFNDIIKRQASVTPNYDLSQTDRKDPYLTPYYEARYKFLMHFYQYASASLNGYPGTWSEWIKDHPIG